MRKSNFQRKRIDGRFHYRRQFRHPWEKDKNGKPKKVSSPWLPTTDEVGTWVSDKRAEIAALAAAIESANDPDKMTLGEMWTGWVSGFMAGDRKSKKRIRGSTAKGYLKSLRTHVPDDLKNKDVREITEEEFQQWLEGVERNHGVDAATRGLSHLKMAFKWAIAKRKFKAANPAALLYAPPKPKRSHEELLKRAQATGSRFLTAEDAAVVTWFMTRKMVGILLGVADALAEQGYVGVDPGALTTPPRETAWERYRALVYVLFLTGMRIGEALALTWNEIDLERKFITIHTTLSDDLVGRTLEAPKTEAGQRDVPIPDDLIPILAAWRKKRGGSGYVFGTKGGLKPEWRQNFYNRGWKIMFEIASQMGTAIAFLEDGLPAATIHDARHFHASVLFEMGLDPKSIARRLGHADESITRRIYIKLLPKAIEEETAKIQGLLGSIRAAAVPEAGPNGALQGI